MFLIFGSLTLGFKVSSESLPHAVSLLRAMQGSDSHTHTSGLALPAWLLCPPFAFTLIGREVFQHWENQALVDNSDKSRFGKFGRRQKGRVQGYPRQSCTIHGPCSLSPWGRHRIIDIRDGRGPLDNQSLSCLLPKVLSSLVLNMSMLRGCRYCPAALGRQPCRNIDSIARAVFQIFIFICSVSSTLS